MIGARGHDRRQRLAARGFAVAMALASAMLWPPDAALARPAASPQLTMELSEALADALAGPTADASAELAGGPAGVACPGDCDGNGIVSVDEIVRGVVIAAGGLDIGACTAFDVNGDGRVTVDELVAAVRRALEGCTGNGAESVCGGPITSAPKLCALRIEPSRVQSGGTITVSFGLSDLEGDVDTICLAIGLVGGTPMGQCDMIDPVGQVINLNVELPGIHVNAAPGDYAIALQVRDHAGAQSDIVGATFTVIRLRR